MIRGGGGKVDRSNRICLLILAWPGLQILAVGKLQSAKQHVVGESAAVGGGGESGSEGAGSRHKRSEQNH